MFKLLSKANLLTITFAASLGGYACSATPSGAEGAGDGDGSGGDGDGDGDIDITPGDGDGDGSIDPRIDDPAPPNCGNGTLDPDEVCDDGDKEANGGCYANCLGIEPGFICPAEGEPCFEFAVCGDGLSKFPEQCDDANVAAGDGCSDNCKIEIGFKCPDDGMPCSPTTCGDGVKEGAEMCEVTEEGCTDACQFAPDCSGAGGKCTSSCGDGLVLGEECDDGNTLDGDGCSATCIPEMGYTCTNESTSGDCERSLDTNECILTIPVTYRDFSTAHSDFESTCSGTIATTGLVEANLDANGKPIATSKADATNGGMCITNFGEWYTDGAHATSYRTNIILYEDGDTGNYVNRWGANGEKWQTSGCGGCTAGLYDGNPFFFPVDNIPDAKADGGTLAQVSTTEYGMTGGLVNDPSSVPRNFSFTSEVAYWFTYDATTNATLNFIGDDDVWVFVNGKRAVDLGGLHQAIPGSVTINSTTGPGFGLEAGSVYEIKVFHAERHTTGSTFKLTLSGFDTSRSDCRPECGDGVVAFGEQCDLGENNGEGYNQCGTDCKLGSFCGDGVVDEGEQCDPGAGDAEPSCANCRVIVVR